MGERRGREKEKRGDLLGTGVLLGFLQGFPLGSLLSSSWWGLLLNN